VERWSASIRDVGVLELWLLELWLPEDHWDDHYWDDVAGLVVENSRGETALLGPAMR
jgi:hypothetical protein